MAIETASLQASGNPKGVSIFHLNATSITTAVEAMMLAFPDDIFQSPEIKRDRSGVFALLERFRRLGFQASAAPSALKNELLSSVVLTAVRKHVDARLPACKAKDGITSDPRCIWSRLRLEGWSQTILLVNIYC